jgi:hypothetical protein
MQSERFRSVTLSRSDLDSLTIYETACTFDGDGKLLKIGLQAYSLGIAYEFDPYFGLSICHWNARFAGQTMRKWSKKMLMPPLSYRFLAVVLSALSLSLVKADGGSALLPSGYLDVSAVPSNGDQNPYGIVFVPDGFPSGGFLTPGGHPGF